MIYKLLCCLFTVGCTLSLSLDHLSRDPVANIFRYSSSRSLTRHLPKTAKEPQNNLMTSIDSYVEQQEMKDDQSDESDLYPIYVLPPPNFQPVIYPNSRFDGIQPAMRFESNKQVALLPPPPRPYPYPFPHGFTSWILGGIRPVQRGSYWEHLSSDLALHNPHQPNHVIVYVKGTVPVGLTSWMLGGVKADGKWQNEIVPSTDSISSNTNIKTKLPVGLTSWFLGGMRDLSGRHWKMPDSLVQRIEFMPKSEKPMSEEEKIKNEYKPVVVKFDDDQDVYNVIKDEK